MRGYVRARGKGRWQLAVYAGRDGSGRERYRYQSITGTKREAERLLAGLVADAHDGKLGSETGTIGDLVDAWWETTAPRLSPSTRIGYRGQLDRRILPRWQRTKVNRLQTLDLERWYAQLEREGLSANTVRNVHVVMSSMFTSAVRWGWLAASPCTRARKPAIPRPRYDTPEPDVLIRLLASASNPEFKVFLRLAAATGARRGELCGIQWRDIDFERAEMVIERAVVHDDGDRRPVTKDTKTGRDRYLALDGGTVEVLRAHRSSMDERAAIIGTRLASDAFVFSDEPDCTRPWRPDTVTVQFVRLRNACGLPRLRLHDLRHAHATLLLAQGVAMSDVRDRLGHSDIRTTGIYLHGRRPGDRLAADLFGRLLDPAVE
jgi:integrase